MSWLKTFREIAIVLAVLAGTFGLGYLGGRRAPQEEIKTQSDTLYFRDTITRYLPAPKAEIQIDSIPVPFPVHDTLYRTDTVYLPRVQRYYEDTEYSAWVSGYDPQLDSIMVFPKTIEIQHTTTRTPKRWNLGVQCGVGVGYNHGIVAVPYVGIGISYSLLQF